MTAQTGGTVAALLRTTEVDRTIVDAVGPALEGRPHVALCAVGSYGRQELTPCSDVDVLLLHSLRGRGDIEALTRSVLYPLWDLGFELGYAVRTVKECLQAAREDPVIATTLFDTRLVAGDSDLAADLDEQLDRWRRKRGVTLERSLLGALDERHSRFGDAGVAVEPHVKEGRGGLRDLQTLRWLDDGEDLDAELDLLLAVRFALHGAAGKREDRLSRELSGTVAGALGCGGADPRDTLLRDVYTACRRVGDRLGRHALATLAPPRRIDAPEGFTISAGRLERTGRAVPEADPVAAIAAARLAAKVAAGPDTMRWACAVPAGTAPIAWTDAARDEFVAFLNDAPRRGWELLDVTGLWTRYLPELSGARARTQHNPLHELAVDAHCWRTLEEARALANDRDPIVRQTYEELDQPDVLLLAALLHDAGKGVPGEHSREGVILARRASERMGFGADVQETLAFAIGNHLVLTEFATGRDLNDEDVVLGLASRLGHPQRLRLLYLLSIADARATGPAAWSEWKAALLAELYDKARRIVDAGDLVGREVENRLSRKHAEAVAHCLGTLGGGGDRAGVAARIDTLGRRYLLAQPVETISTHLRMIDSLGSSADGVEVEAAGDTISVVTRDRPGLLATVAGVLASRGISVRTADVYTTADALAVDVLTVSDSHDSGVPATKWSAVRGDLEEAMRGSRDFEARLAERAGRYDAPPVPDVDVRIDNLTSDWYSVVEVRTPDRVGMLSAVAAVLTDLGLDVHYAKVATEGAMARDSFSVRDADGQRIGDPETVASAVRERLLARLSGGDGETAPR